MHPHPRAQTRRHLLRATLGAVAALPVAAFPVAGCGIVDDDPEPPPAPDPLAPLLTEALDLAARHEAAIAAHPELAGRLTPMVRAHREHAAELARITGAATATATPTASAGAPAGDARAALAALRTAEQTGQKNAAAACLAAPAERAVLLGSIAAARATHIEVLR